MNCTGRVSETTPRSTELAADGGDDRHRQIGGAPQRADRDRLEARQRRKHALDPARALGEADRARDVADDGRQATARGTQVTEARSTARRSRISPSTAFPLTSPYESRSTFASASSGHVWMLRCD